MGFGILILALELGVSVSIIYSGFSSAKPSERWLAICIGGAPSLVLLALYYSLACDMYLTLGGWPPSIGERGFPPHLLSHATVGTSFFVLTIWSILVWPILWGICLLIPIFRSLRIYLGVYVITLALSYGLMLLAPSKFEYWWID